MSVFTHQEFDHHEQVVFGHDAESGLKAIIAIHNSNRGPALGGCRMWAYENDEAALTEALRSGHLAGAVLDVFEHEPLPLESPLWDMPHVIISPHIGGDEADTPRAFADAFLVNLRHYLAGEPLDNVVDKHLGFVPPEH